MIERVRIASEDAGLFFNVMKTEIMACVNDDEPVMLTVGGQAIDVVQYFNFLGSYITNKGGSAKEVKRRLAIARQAAIELSKIWKSRDIAKRTKTRLMNALVFSIALYGSETWTPLKGK